MNTTRRRPRLLAPRIVIASLALVAVSACGSSDDTKDDAATESTPSAVATTAEQESNSQLEAYVDKVRTQSEGEMARFDDLYSDFQVSAEGDDTLVYDYTFANEVDPAAAKTQIEGTRSVLEGAAKAIFTEMEAAGVQDPKVRWTYRNPDGAELVSIQLP